MPSYKDIYEIPDNLDRAYNHPNKWQRNKWREAIQNELDKMQQYDVWNVVPRNSIPPNRRCVNINGYWISKEMARFEHD
jgi:hypothetical protein